MLLGFLYQLAYRACLIFPKRVCYFIARRIADLCYLRSPKDRQGIRQNLKAVLQVDPVPEKDVRATFHHFAMYLVDFFQFGRLTPERVRRLVRIEGLEKMKQALSSGKGAIGLTAHLGNYELAGAVLSLLGLPVSAVVLTHQNRRVDAFFTRQRARVGVKGIPVLPGRQRELLQGCLSSLKRNEILALVGDRDFFDHGLSLCLFGKSMRIPTGPASFSLKTGAPIVPGFLVREKDHLYRFILEEPLSIPQGVPPKEGVRQMTEECLKVMERYIRQYPTQWYMFQEFWRSGPAVIL